MVKRNTQGAYAERSAASLATATSSLDALCGLHMMSNCFRVSIRSLRLMRENIVKIADASADFPRLVLMNSLFIH